MLAAGWFPAAAAQSENQKGELDPKTTTRVALASTAGTPGTSVVVPVYFTPAEGVEVGSLQLDVSFVSVNLKFEKVERGPAAESGNLDLTAQVKSEKNEKGIESSKLTILTSFPEPPKKGIPTGLLAYLTFRIGGDVKASSISLTTSAEAKPIGSDTILKQLRTFDTKVEILAPGTLPLTACFFFSH